MTAASPLLEISGLRITSAAGAVVDDVSLTIGRGESVGIVGESGSGKSLTCRAALGIVPENLRVTAERLAFDGQELQTLTERDWRRVRGSRIGAVFQDPASYLNPSIPVGRQIAEVLRVKLGRSRRAAKSEAVEALARLGLRDPLRVATRYPHELSGGMLQRVLIALAIVETPDLLIADEPTTALDATVQAEVLDVLADLRRETGLALLFVSHDLAVVAQICDRILVMRDGRIQEQGSAADVLGGAQHPYTRSLLDAHHEYGLDRFREREAVHV
ncbi:MAG: ABC transporter ATP-binding protein [Microbacterium sp.]